MERAIERQLNCFYRLKSAAAGGCPNAQAAVDALEEDSLPHPTTAVVTLVRDALTPAADARQKDGDR